MARRKPGRTYTNPKSNKQNQSRSSKQNNTEQDDNKQPEKPVSDLHGSSIRFGTLISKVFQVATENSILFLLGISAVLLLSPLTDNLPQPFGSKELFSYYFQVRTIPPDSPPDPQLAGLMEDLVSLVVKPKKEPISIHRVRVRGVSESRKCIAVLRDVENGPKGINLECSLDKGRELLSIKGTNHVPQNGTLVVNMWGHVNFDAVPVVELTDGRYVWPTKARLVEGRLLFLADYWNLVVALIIITMTGLYYVIKRRAHLLKG